MPDVSLDRDAHLKAEAIATRRARREPWQNAHADRIARDREARRTAQGYRQAQKEAERTDGKTCAKCGEAKPASEFELRSSGNLRGTCKACKNARKVERRCQLRGPEREARVAKKASQQLATRAAAQAKQERKQAAQQLEAAERIARLTSLLSSKSQDTRITSDQAWEGAVSELQRLWLLSGDKVCLGCGDAVPASAMLPPVPCNFYRGKCRSCARAEYEANQLDVFGHLSGPRLIPMLDGSSITLGEFVRRHRERTAAKPYAT